MEKIENKINNKIDVEQIINLTNKKDLQITAVKKIISLKPELIQLETLLGGLILYGHNLELLKLDDHGGIAYINGEIDQLKFVDSHAAKSFFRKLFK